MLSRLKLIRIKVRKKSSASGVWISPEIEGEIDFFRTVAEKVMQMLCTELNLKFYTVGLRGAKRNIKLMHVRLRKKKATRRGFDEMKIG